MRRSIGSRWFDRCGALSSAIKGPWSGFAASRAGAAAVEFALVVPFLIALLLAGVELSRYIKSSRQLTAASTTVAGLLAQNTSGTVSDTDLLFFRDAIMIADPSVLADAYADGSDWLSEMQVTMSSIAFKPTQSGCTSNCQYTATVSWSGGSNPRPCNKQLTAAADDATPTSGTLPKDSFGPGSLLVVDLKYPYRPRLAGSLLGPLTIARSFYVQPRYVASVSYSANGTNFAKTCS